MSIEFNALRNFIVSCAASVLVMSGSAFAQVQPGYRLEAATVLPSTDTGWDYVEFDPAKSYLYIAHRADGMQIFDVKTQKLVRTLDDSVGANSVTLVPEFDRGYVANQDGTTTVFEISSLKTLARFKVDDDLNANFYEPTTKQVIFTSAERPSGTSRMVSLDAKTGKIVHTMDIAGQKINNPVVDGRGNIFVAMRDKNLMYRINAQDMKILATWPMAPCDAPAAFDIDKAGHRLLLGCRSTKPVFIAMDADSGNVVASLPIGTEVNALFYDHETKRIFTANGGDGSLTVIEQQDANHYRLLENVSTRPGARMMAYDQKTKRAYVVTAEFTVIPPAGGTGAPRTIFFPNTFVVLTYAAK